MTALRRITGVVSEVEAVTSMQRVLDIGPELPPVCRRTKFRLGSAVAYCDGSIGVMEGDRATVVGVRVGARAREVHVYAARNEHTGATYFADPVPEYAVLAVMVLVLAFAIVACISMLAESAMSPMRSTILCGGFLLIWAPLALAAIFQAREAIRSHLAYNLLRL